MASALTVLLEGSYPKPSISISPGGVIPVGGNVTIWCGHQYPGMRFLLYKAGDGNYLTYTDPVGYVAEFPITSARREHSGSYTCRSTYRTGPAAYSEPSDPVQIIVAVTRADRGSYTCYYPPDSDPDTWSEPSDPVKLVVAEPSYPKPNISMSPSGGVSLGGAVTVRCRGQRRGVWFVLNKERRHFPPVDSDGFEAVFSSSNVHRDLGGSYSCSYHSRSEPFAVSYPSDPMELVVRDPSLPRPSISLSPTGVTAPGADVTIWCQGQRRDVRFFLHKAGDLNLQRHVDPAGDVAKFRIRNVGRQHGGNYSCSYRRRSEPFVSSYTSSYVELVVADGSESPASPGLTSLIITGVSAAAAGLLLLLLLVALVCFRKTRANSSVDEGKETQTLEPDPDGLTYAELDGRVLQAKRGGPAHDPEPSQPSVYAAINVSRGALQ
ncbi:leukocyte immunoglobulin-like receptor subfamily A member 6 [Terrapene carolina triunguis]|uniref:leukocyte immunoglobulin-like receptor subfamily A member 6 n=1 Tax=Terrapene triunguis TaxID=2587831 RepID=UPI001156706A|nr:leukocyte immunoglobulin-like receptor subfamily A member 6 [Terrapene carolina triunguis]